MVGGPRHSGRFFGKGRGRPAPTSRDGWDSRRLPVGVGQEDGHLWEDLVDGTPGGIGSVYRTAPCEESSRRRRFSSVPTAAISSPLVSLKSGAGGDMV